MIAASRLRSRTAIAALFAIVAAALLAFATQPASAVTASAAAVQDLDVSLVGDENDGQYAWDGMKDPWIKDADAIFVNSGSTRFFFVWPPSNGSHDVKLRASQSTPGLTFPNSVLHQNYGTEDERWPSTGWLPVKAGTYQLYCSKHTGMKMRVIVKASVAKIAATSKSLRAGVRKVSATISANFPARSSVQVVQCLNSSCSKAKKVGSTKASVRAGSNPVTVSTAALAAGRYQVRSVTADVTRSAAFTVKASSSGQGPRFTG